MPCYVLAENVMVEAIQGIQRSSDYEDTDTVGRIGDEVGLRWWTRRNTDLYPMTKLKSGANRT